MSNQTLPLAQFWHYHNVHWKEDCGWNIPAYFTNPEEEYQTLIKSAVLIDQSHRGKILVTGNDRITFLNNMLTNDIRALIPGQSCRALLLSAQGKCLADFRVFVFNNFMILDTEPCFAEASIKLLDKFIIAEDAQLKDISRDYVHLSLEGPESQDAYAKHLRHCAPAVAGAAISKRASFSGENAIALFIPNESAKKTVVTLLQDGLPPCGHDALDRRRIENRIPRFKKDFDENWFLNETELEETAASETKGCYPGQEVVARFKTYGGGKKKILNF